MSSGKESVIGCVYLEHYCSLRRLACDGMCTDVNYSNDIKRFSVNFRS